MTIYIISDSHFNHTNILKYANRPFTTIEEMNEAIISNWNKKVGKNDTVLHLGDFALGKKTELMAVKDRLNGHIILINGSHDRDVLKLKDDKFIIVEGTLKLGHIIFSHEPLTKKDIPVGFTNVHGHIHNLESFNGLNVSVEKTLYTPLSLDELQEAIKELNKVKGKNEKTKR
jgi:calcineurin-like phosphoesterase family protein